MQVVVGRLPRCLDAWRAIGASAFVLQIVGDGLRLTLLGQPEEDDRQLPFTAAQLQWLGVELHRLMAAQAIEWMGQGSLRPLGIVLISPVFLVPKHGPKLWRLVINQRRLNLCLAVLRCKFKSLATLIQLAGQGWWAITFNLAQGYHHISIHPNSLPWFGFRVGQDWYCYQVIPFSLCWSPWVFTKVVWTMVKSWRALRVLVFVYVDDFAVVASLLEELQRICDMIISPSLAQLGWIREMSKGQWELSQLVEVMGLLLDLLQGRISIPEAKLARAEVICCVKASSQLTRRDLARIVGFVTSLKRAAPQVQLYLCEAYTLLGGQHNQWDKVVVIPRVVVLNLNWIADNLRRIQGAKMWRPSHVAVVLTDAAQSVGWGAHLPETGDVARGGHSASEKCQLIHLLEMRAILHGLSSFTHLLHGRQVECRTDNTTALACLVNGGSPCPTMTLLAKQIYALLNSISASLYKAVWVKGSLNIEADAASRWVDHDDWTVFPHHFHRMWLELGPWTVDRFADHINHQAPRFNSLFLVPGTEAQDAFSVAWGLIVVPRWEAQPWWPVLLRVTTKTIVLGRGADVAEPGPSGECEPARGWWMMEAWAVDGARFTEWSRAASTVRGYALLWRDFKGFALSLGRSVMPASSDTVMDFLTWLDLSGRGGRAGAAVSAIAREHVLVGAKSPSTDPRVRLLADGVERAWAKTGKRDFKRDPFPMGALHAHVRRGRAGGDLWLRDALLVALGLRTMRRAAELAALRIEDVTWLADRELLCVYIWSSKVDQAGWGFEIFVERSLAPWCPVWLHRQFMLQRGSAPGLLFWSAGGRPLTSSTITSICKWMVRDAGVDAVVSLHSLCIGGATAAMMGGLCREQIMAIGGWHSGAVDWYLRAVEVTKVGASTLILGTGL